MHICGLSIIVGKYFFFLRPNCIGGVKVRVLASSAVDLDFGNCSIQTKDKQIGINLLLR